MISVQSFIQTVQYLQLGIVRYQTNALFPQRNFNRLPVFIIFMKDFFEMTRATIDGAQLINFHQIRNNVTKHVPFQLTYERNIRSQIYAIS